MRQTLDAKLLLLSVTYTWRIDTMPVYDFGIRFSYRTTGETKQDTYTANVSSEGCVGWEPESICFDMQKVNSDEGLNSNTMCWKLSWEKMSIASTLQFEMKWLYWLKDTRKQDPYVIYVFFSLLFLSTFWADMIDHKGIRGAAVSVFRATCSTLGSSQFHIPLCNVWVR